MDKPIGIIDSGVGGLTVAYEIFRKLPQEDFVYLGDTLRCPYGSRSKEEVIRYTFEMAEFLLSKSIKMMIIACNTATAYTLNLLQENLDIPVIGVIQPGALTAIRTTKNNKISIIGTEATIKSKAYEKALTIMRPEIKVDSISCPLFVPLIESGILKGPRISNTVKKSLAPIKQTKSDTLILGCTHYPLIQNVIQKELGCGVKVISSGEETARETSAILELYGIENEVNKQANYEFYTTGDSNTFVKIARNLFNVLVSNVKSIDVNVVSI